MFQYSRTKYEPSLGLRIAKSSSFKGFVKFTETNLFLIKLDYLYTSLSIVILFISKTKFLLRLDIVD